MKVIVVSDTHGMNKPFINELKNHEDASLILHLGDMVNDVEEIKNHTKVPVKVVRGNNDYNDEFTPWHQLIRLEGHKILMTHGHHEGVNYGRDGLLRKAKECDADIILYGHTHIFDSVDMDGIKILNPGSAGYDRAGEYESFAILNITKNSINITRVKL